MRQYTTADWNTVDRTADPAAYVDYLDTLQRQEGVRAYKHQTYELLKLRPGQTVLDVGCGAGDDVQALARLVAPSGKAIGLDSSLTMIEEARNRTEHAGLPAEFLAGDAQELQFEDGLFDCSRADRLFQHLERPEKALAELIRVTKQGGRVVVADTDWGTLAVDSADERTTQAIATEVAATIRNPWSGRRLFGMFRRAGLEEVHVTPVTAVITDFALADNLLHLSDGLRRARSRNLIPSEAEANWMRWQLGADAAGRFCAILTLIIVAGQRPRQL